MRYLIASYNTTPTIYEIIQEEAFKVIPHLVNSIPSYMVNDNKYIYVANKSGGISIYDFHLQLIAECIDEHPYTHICVNNSKIVAVSYRDGISSLFEYKDTLIKRFEYQHHGSHHDPHKRQESAHPHFITPLTNNKYLMCDLGSNALTTLQDDDEQITEYTHQSIIFDNSCGPRHLMFQKDQTSFLLVNEVNNTLVLLSFPDYSVLDTISLGEDTTKLNEITHSLSAIRYNEANDTYYVSDRNHFDVSKVWAIKVINNKLEVINTTNVGKHPRDIYIDGTLLLVACMLDDTVEIYDISTNTKITTLPIIEPVCVLPLKEE